jgi:hypothetical protein
VAATWYHRNDDPNGKIKLNRGFTLSTNDGQTRSRQVLIGCHEKPLPIDLSHAAVVNGKYFLG